MEWISLRYAASINITLLTTTYVQHQSIAFDATLFHEDSHHGDMLEKEGVDPTPRDDTNASSLNKAYPLICTRTLALGVLSFPCYPWLRTTRNHPLTKKAV